MSFVRPEVSRLAWQWRDVLKGAAVVVFGLWIILRTHGFLVWLGVAIILAGLMLAWTGVIRARFRVLRDGPGVIEIDERQVTVFGPVDGGSFSLDEVRRIEIETTGKGALAPDMFWLFHLATGEVQRIAGSATGAELIFDELASFPGAAYENVIAASQSADQGRFLVWQKGD